MEADGRLDLYEHVDCLEVLIPSVGVEQLLAIPKLIPGIAQASAIIQCLEEWDIGIHVTALCFIKLHQILVIALIHVH